MLLFASSALQSLFFLWPIAFQNVAIDPTVAQIDLQRRFTRAAIVPLVCSGFFFF